MRSEILVLVLVKTCDGGIEEEGLRYRTHPAL